MFDDEIKKSDYAKVMTCYLMNRDIEFIDRLVEEGYFLSRSATIRLAVREFVKNFIEFHSKIEEFKPIKNPMTVMELAPNGWKIIGLTHEVKRKI